MEWCKSQCGRYRIESLSAATVPGSLNVRFSFITKQSYFVLVCYSINPSTLNWRLLKDHFRKDVKHVIREAFCQDEAVCIGSEVNKSPQAVKELQDLSADTALDGVSLVAIHLETDQVVAVSFNKLQVPVENPNEPSYFDTFVAERCKDASSQSLINFMSAVDSNCNLFDKYDVNCSLEIMFLATLREHRRKSLGTLLCQSSIDLAKKLSNGYVPTFTKQDLGTKISNLPNRTVPSNRPKICQAIFTSNASHHLGAKLKFTTEATVPYSEFSHNGKTYADRIGPESPFCYLVSRML